MLDFPRWKQLFYWFLTLAACAATLPSICLMTGISWPSALPAPRINLGLDLAGGSHLLLEASADQVISQRLEVKEDQLRTALKKSGKVHFGDISNKGGALSFMVQNPSEVDAAREAIVPLTNGAGLTGKRDWDLTVQDTTRLVLTPTKEGVTEEIDRAMDTAVDVVRKRIDALGTREPTIIRQGADRIVVQVPGLKDPAQLKALLGQTAKLEFKLVDETASPASLAQGVVPPGDELLPYAEAGQGGIAVYRLGGIKGDRLTDARQSFDQNNQAVVSISFDQQGGEQFARLTSQNINKRFAIILDGKVLSAPAIRSAIMGGSAEISGSFTAQSAGQLAISLRSGALPVDLKVVEERTVGPDLGADSINKGVIAMAVGTLVVVVFMAVTYGRFGLYADAAVLLNVLMILGIMALMNTTLTLPGIAGFVLTIGTAVDANVLINERIREERKRGRKVFQSVEIGYKEASRTIFDANITHIIAAVLMFEFGSGPVKGFAVVLMIGIATSVFTAVFMTRMWVAGWLRRTRPADLTI